MGIMITVGIIPVCDAHQKMGVHYTWQNTVGSSYQIVTSNSVVSSMILRLFWSFITMLVLQNQLFGTFKVLDTNI